MQPSFVPEDPRVESPRIDPRERLRVVTGEGRQADQAVSPAFTRDESASLEVMRSVYSSPTRIRDLASSSMGLVDADETVTVDLSGTSASADAE